MSEASSFEKRSMSLKGHRTSLALEPEFWAVLEQAADADSLSMAALIVRIDANRPATQPLSSAARVFALNWLSRALPGEVDAGSP